MWHQWERNNASGMERGISLKLALACMGKLQYEETPPNPRFHRTAGFAVRTVNVKALGAREARIP